MRKRSKYRPKPVLANPVGFVLEGFTPVRSHSKFMTDLMIKNHGAMTSLMRGTATRTDIDMLIQMINVTEALYRLGFGAEYGDVVRDALAALRSVGARGAATGRFVLNAEEIRALNAAIELHDAQMDVVTLNDISRAVDLVAKELQLKRATPIVTSSS